MEKEELTETKGEDLKSQNAIRCAKALLLISSLKNRRNQSLSILNNGDDDEETDQEIEGLLRSNQDLKLQLMVERLKNRKFENPSTFESALQILREFSFQCMLVIVFLVLLRITGW